MIRRIALAAMLAAACRGSDRELPRAQNFAGPAGLPQQLETAKRRVHELEGAIDGKAMNQLKDEVATESGAQIRAASPAAGKPAPGGGGKPSEGPTRAWFPETFLFEPLVVTDDDGAAVVPVRVPDRLTTWRVLALAHSCKGAQGGAVASFLGTLPVYVDPVVPPFLVEGDEVRIPIQLVNTTASPVTGALEVSVAGAGLRRAVGGSRTVPAQGSALDHATVIAAHPGPVVLRVALGGADAVERRFEVRPAGRPVVETRSGTLAAPRSFTTSGTPGADAATDRVRLLVFPGALALLRSELAMSPSRGEPADDAYALLLAGRAAALQTALGDKPDLAALRALAVVAGQRAIRAARTLDLERAALLAEPAAVQTGNPVISRLGERAVAYLARAQRPDGTFGGGQGWTLQRVLAATAEATRAITAAQAAADQAATAQIQGGAAAPTAADRQRALGVQTRAAAAFARTADQVSDGYTAAAILASGAVPGESALAEVLRGRVRGAIRTGDDGASYLAVEAGVVRAGGAVPSRIEATALAVLALEADPKAPDPALADLGTTLLGGYIGAVGWGDGRTNLVAMRAVLALFKDPVPRAVEVTLAMDGQPILRGTLEGAKLRDVLALDGPAPGLSGPHRFALTAEPAVAGLGYALELASWVPWDRPAPAGLELAVPARIDAAVGAPVAIAVTAVAPSGLPLHIRQALPAGVQVDAPSLEAQVASGAILKFTAADGMLDLYAPALLPGKTFALDYRAIATLAGTLHTGPSRIEAGADHVDVPPATWAIK